MRLPTIKVSIDLSYELPFRVQINAIASHIILADIVKSRPFFDFTDNSTLKPSMFSLDTIILTSFL